MALRVKNQFFGDGGHRPVLEFNEKDLKDAINKLDKLYPKNQKGLNSALQSAMAFAMRPAKTDLKKRLPASKRKHGGRLKKSIKIFKGKPRRNQWPVVFLGPEVKVPKKLKPKKGESRKSAKARHNAWVKASSGYYMYFLEYGFAPGPKNQKSFVGGKNYLRKTLESTGDQVLNRLSSDVMKQVDKRFKKRFG